MRPENWFFDIFFKFRSLVFLSIAEDDSLEESLTTSSGKKNKIKLRGPKLGPQLGFSPFSQV